MSKELITQATATLIRNHGRRIISHAYLTRGDGSGTLIADQASRKAFYWMPGSDGAPKVAVATLHPQSSIIFQNSIEYETIPVDIGYVERDDTLYIMGENSFGVSGGGGTTIVERAITAAADKTVVLPLSVQADQNQPSLVVWVQAYTFDIAGTIYQFPTTAVDLTNYIPGTANYMCYAVLFLQSDYTTIEVQTSTPRSASGIPLNGTDIQVARTAATSTSLAIFAVKLINGQTTIAQSDLNSDGDPLQQNLNTLASPGNVSGPGSSTLRALPSYADTTGKVLLDNPNTNVDASGNLTVNAWRLPAATTLTIAASAVTITQGYHLIEASSGTTDNLATISGGVAQQLLIIQADADDTITVKHGTGNIFLNSGADQAISGKQTLALFYHGSNWTDVDFGGSTSPLTTKGDLYTHSTVDARLAVGSNDKPLVADSSQATGLIYKTLPVAGGGTGAATLAAHAALIGNGTNAVNALAPGTTRNVAISDGTDWASRALVDADIPDALTISGGTVDNTVIGGTTKSAGTFTTLKGDTLQVNASSLAASAVAEIDSTTKGLLIPSMTTTQRNAIGSPADGLLVYDTTLHQLWQYQNGAWAQVGAGGGSLEVTDGTTDITGVTKIKIIPSGSVSNPGGGEADITLAGGDASVLNVNTTSVANSGSSETDLITFSVPASTLASDGDYIHGIGSGSFAGTLGSKRLKVKLGSTTLFDTGTLSISTATDWTVEYWIIRTGSSAEYALFSFTSSSATLMGFAQVGTGAEDLTTALTLKMTGTGGATNDITQKSFTAEKYHKGGSSGSGGVVYPGVCDGRLTLTSGMAITTSDVTAASTIYFTPYKGDHLSLYSGSGSTWMDYTFTERSLALSSLTSGKNYDVFIYDNSGTLTLELVAWTSDTARATAITLQDGVYCKNGALTHRYLGTIRTTGTTTTEDSLAKRFVYNYDHRVRRRMYVAESTGSASTNSSYGSSFSDAAFRTQFVIGLNEEPVTTRYSVRIAGGSAQTALSLDSTSTVSSPEAFWLAGNQATQVTEYYDWPGIGFHFLQAIDKTVPGQGAGTLFGTNTNVQGWLQGDIWA